MEPPSTLDGSMARSITLHVSCCCGADGMAVVTTVITRTRSLPAMMRRLRFGDRPASSNLWRLPTFGGLELLGRLLRHSVGRLDAEARELVPEHEQHRVVESRVMVVILAAAVMMAAAVVLFPSSVGGSTILGGWLVVFFGITQHAGLQEDVLDHRRNTRTVMMNPVFRFLYLNMNFHVEHPVSECPLPRVARSRRIGPQLAPALPSTGAAYRQIFSALRKQRNDSSYEIPIGLPTMTGGKKRLILAGIGCVAQGGHPRLKPVGDGELDELMLVIVSSLAVLRAEGCSPATGGARTKRFILLVERLW